MNDHAAADHIRADHIRGDHIRGDHIRGDHIRAGLDPSVPQWAMISAALTPMLLAAAWVVADALQPSSYSPVRQTVSVMAGYGGTDRWIVTGAVFAVGGCYFVTAAGLSGLRPPARLLLVVAGLSSIGIAASPEPVHGSTPAHVAWAVLGAVTIAVWPAFVTGPAVGWPTAARPLILNAGSCAAVTAVFLVLLGWLFIETQGGADLGLAERLTSGVQTTWPFIVAVALRRSASLSGPPAPDVRAADACPADTCLADTCPADTESSRRRAGCRT